MDCSAKLSLTNYRTTCCLSGPNLKSLSADSGLSPQFAHFLTTSPQLFKFSFPHPHQTFRTVHDGTVVATETMKKKLGAADDTIYFEARRAEQTWGRNKTGKKQKQDLYEVFAGKRSRIDSTVPGGTPHIQIKAEDVVMEDSGFGQFSDKVGVSSADFRATVLKLVMLKYCYILDLRFQNLLDALQTVGVFLYGR